jgi:hypothetical protein
MSVRAGLMVLVVVAGLFSCGKKDGGDAPDCADSISEAANEFAAQYAEGYCDLRDQCLSPDESVDDCKKRTSRGQLSRACNGCSLDSDVSVACMESASSIQCDEWEDDWDGDEKKPIRACANVWVGCD